MVLLLTACIAPRSDVAQSRHDVASRLADYRASLRTWLELPESRITGLVFVDNSNHDVDLLREEANRHNRFERELDFLTFLDKPAPPGVHYGFGELGIVDHALEHSTLLKPTGTPFIKSTGRLFFPAVPRLLDRLPQDLLAAVDSRRRRDGFTYASTQLLFFDREFYLETLKGRRSWLRPMAGRSHMENLVFERLLPASSARVLMRFPVNAEPVGVSGTWGTDYRNPQARAKALLRAVSRKLAPGAWL